MLLMPVLDSFLHAINDQVLETSLSYARVVLKPLASLRMTCTCIRPPSMIMATTPRVLGAQGRTYRHFQPSCSITCTCS